MPSSTGGQGASSRRDEAPPDDGGTPPAPRDTSPHGSPGGRTVDRVVQFSDGVFTVALTLLVVDLAVPELAPGSSEADLQRALQAQIPNVLAFLLTFRVLALTG